MRAKCHSAGRAAGKGNRCIGGERNIAVRRGGFERDIVRRCNAVQRAGIAHHVADFADDEAAGLRIIKARGIRREGADGAGIGKRNVLRRRIEQEAQCGDFAGGAVIAGELQRTGQR